MKQIIGFKSNIKNDNDICPNCNHRTFRFPLGVEIDKGFLGFKHESYLEYTCDKCGCIWKVI